MLASPITHAGPRPCARPSLHSRNCKLLLSSSALARYKPLKNPSLHLLLRSCNGRRFNYRVLAETRVADSAAEPPHDAFPPYSVKIPVGHRHEGPCSRDGRHRQISGLESLFCYDKAIPEQMIEKPVGLSIGEKDIGDQPRCTDCQAKGAVLCCTCGGSGLYVDSILESQGIIVKVRCLGCGGTGNIMCSECGGRGHL